MVFLTIVTTALNLNREMTDFNYKKYSLENLEKWLNDALSSAEATPQEIYDVIVGVVRESYDYHKEQSSQVEELLNLLNSGWTKEDVLKERDYYEPPSSFTFSSCTSDDTSPECMTSWSDFWSNNYTNDFVDFTSIHNTDTFSNINHGVKVDGYSVDGVSHSKYWYEYDRNDPNRPNPFGDRVVKWQLPVQVDGLTGDCFVNLPDDLLERAGLKEGDTVEWIDRNDCSFEVRKVNGTV
jgi:hypothetical protein